MPSLLASSFAANEIAPRLSRSLKQGFHNPLGYLPSNSLAAVSLILYLLVTLTHTWRLYKFGGKYMLATIIAGYFYSIGLAMRYAVRHDPDSLGIYIIMNMCTTLAPCGFIASTYMLLGRMAVWLRCPHHLLLRASRVTLIFVMSDVITFLIQAGGGGLSASSNNSSRQLGAHIFLVGLILQLVSFVFFMVVFLLFLYRVRTVDPSTWGRDRHESFLRDWRTLAYAIGLSCLGILIRSFYRVIELSQGYSGHLSTTEGYFYGLDALPLWLAIVVYVVIWPGKFIPDGLDLKYGPVVGSAQTIVMEDVPETRK